MTAAGEEPNRQAEPLPDRMWHRRSIVTATLRRVAVRIALVVAVATLVSFLHVRSSLKEQALEQLENFVVERRERESIVFELAAERLVAVAAGLADGFVLGRGVEDAAAFDRLFEPRPDGTIRLRRELYDRYGVTGLVGKNTRLTPELEQRLVRYVEVLATQGPAWRSRFRNLFLVTPENAVLMYWPGRPWALEASDWEVYGKLELTLGKPGEVVVLGAPDGPPATGLSWSEPYFDYGAREWVVSAIQPVVSDGRLVATVGNDLLLTELIDRTLAPPIPGTYSMILTADGRLIAHPRYMTAIRAESRAIEVAAIGDGHLERSFAAISTAPPGAVILDAEDNELIAATRLGGPGWYLATLFPEALVEEQAVRTAQWVLVLGLAALLIELLILQMTLRRRVALPLGELVQATSAVAAGRFKGELPEDRPDELGRLARAFRTMMEEVSLRETALSDRNQELATLNAQLSAELEERKRAQALLERQRELRTLLDTIDYGVLITGADGRVRMFNRAYRELTGLPEPLLASHPPLDSLVDHALQTGLIVVPEAERAAYRRSFSALIDEASPEATEWQHANGRLLRRQIAALPDGGRLVTLYDLTPLKRTEAALVAARDEALRANRAKSAFLANVSHEFRTPLNAITGYSELMLEEAEEAGAHQLVPDLERIRDAGNQLLSLINDILDLSKIEAGRIDVRSTAFDLVPLLRTTSSMVRPMVKAPAVELQVEIAPDLPPVLGDPDRVRQILVNLAGNAAKFTDVGRVLIAASAGPEWVVVRVTDTGLGIPDGDREAIFEEFRQVASGPGTGRQGTGLGLAIARRLARLMGGDITVRSELGTGSIFTLTLPRAVATAAAQPGSQSRTAWEPRRSA